MKQQITVALAGNPNSGKSTIFNALTGAHQHVGNYPGVTVERKEGACRHNGREMKIVDLPGIYSLTAYSAEELVARDFIVNEKPDVVVDIIDASNLERNLYLTTQLMELGVPLVLVFNMSDQAKARGHEFDLEKLSGFFKARIVSTVGHKGLGVNDLLDAVEATADGAGPGGEKVVIDYGRETEEEVSRIEALIQAEGAAQAAGANAAGYDARWLAVKLLENDKDVKAKLHSPAIDAQVEKSARHIEEVTGEHPETSIPGHRYGFISGACQEAVRSTIEIRHTMSDRIDSVVTNRVLGIPVFLLLMYLVFSLTFTLGEPPMGWIETGFEWLGGVVTGWWPEGSESALKSLLVDGVIGGVGGVVVFLPNILLLFLAIAILEDSGYMARAAFIMDRLMHKIGLHGKSFIPMLIGFGCSVPAIMATRTLDNQRDRLTTMLVTPLMSCGARLPIYMLLIPAFFPAAWQAKILWIIYVIGIALAIVFAKVLRVTLFKGDSVPFVMELPPYRIPTVRGVLIHMWERGWLYLKKAGTVILGVSILLWAISSYPKKEVFDQDYEGELAKIEERMPAAEGDEDALAALEGRQAALENAQQEEELSYSIAGRIGHALDPVLKPMGFDWRIGTALIGAFAAKEVFVAQMGIVYSVGEADEESDSLRDKLRDNYTPLVAFCIMIFCLTSAPCMATIAVTRRESNSWKWAMLQLGGLTAVAYVLTVLIYQFGRLFGLG
ncbi:MAG: ferrous iron transport protein B [Acidobacteriota bacterium]|jgi:ferrous iron transport protein B|nr:ferrous iron transport protein B [Acidobacteriota bacterium]